MASIFGLRVAPRSLSWTRFLKGILGDFSTSLVLVVLLMRFWKSQPPNHRFHRLDGAG